MNIGNIFVNGVMVPPGSIKGITVHSGAVTSAMDSAAKRAAESRRAAANPQKSKPSRKG